MLEVGMKAPDFTLYNQDNQEVKLSDYLGKKVILYFYPKDNTAGCTKQACGFSERIDDFHGLNCDVVGISKDSVASHKRFEEKQNLKITILADPDLNVIKMYDVYHEKYMYGKKVMGVVRTTYVIDEKGTIVFAKEKVKAANNPEDMLELLKKEVDNYDLSKM